MALLDLPPELIDDIIEWALPHSFENFALSCRTIYRRASAHIERHSYFKEVARKASRLGDHDDDISFELLLEISRDPTVCRYIKFLSFWPLHKYSIPPNQKSNLIRTNCGGRVKDFATRSRWQELAGIDVNEWWKGVAHEDPNSGAEGFYSYSFMSVMGHLPDLETLQLPPGWTRIGLLDDPNEQSRRLIHALSTMVDLSNTTTAPTRPLAKLAKLLPYCWKGHTEQAPLQSLQPLFRLKNLTELFGVSCVADDRDTQDNRSYHFKWYSPDYSSLRRIELAHSFVSAEGLAELLSHTPQLEVFKYSHETKWVFYHHDWNPGAMVVELARYCSHSIREIAITIDHLGGEIVNGASTFLSFAKLRSIEADVQVFCGPPVESGQTRGARSFVPEGDREWTAEDIPCIGSMLPNSIEDVAINTDGPGPDGTALVALLKNIKEQRAERLSRLHTVTIRQYNDNSMRDVTEDAQVSLVVFGAEGRNEHTRDMMPEWKRNFRGFQRTGHLW